jgi:hypothetical protein
MQHGAATRAKSTVTRFGIPAIALRSTHASRAVTGRPLASMMVKTMNNAVFSIKEWQQGFKKPTIRKLVSPKRCPRNQVRKLDHTGRCRINKERDLSKVPEMSPFPSINPKSASKDLQWLLMLCLIHYNKTALIIRKGFVASTDKQIESVTYLFKSLIHLTFRGNGISLNNHGEQRNASAIVQRLKSFVNHAFAFGAITNVPPHTPALIHRTAMQLDLMHIPKIKRSNTLICRSNLMIKPPFED